jgi:hypothetical protein
MLFFYDYLSNSPRIQRRRPIFEAAMALPMKDILPVWRQYLEAIQARRAEIMRIPLSEIFENEARFMRFVNTNGLAITSGK